MPRQFSLGLSAQQLRTIKDPRSARSGAWCRVVRKSAANALVAWHGRSRMPVVCKAIPLAIAGAHDLVGTVAIAAALGDNGSISLVGVTADCANPAGWLAEMKAAGAVELHVHGLQADAAARAGVVSYLALALVKQAA